MAVIILLESGIGLPDDIYSLTLWIPILSAIIISGVIFGFSYREDRKIQKSIKATAMSLISEKTAVIYRSALEAKGWNDTSNVPLIVKRIKMDLKAVEHISPYAEGGQEAGLREAVGLLDTNMRDRFPDEASEIRSAFANIKRGVDPP